jgi:type III restriction enzyme
MSAVTLFEFQREAADQLAEAAQEWVTTYASDGPLKLGRLEVPFLGHLKAVTGAGKTPILAATCAQLGPALVLWTSKSNAVVEQTYSNLLGKYRSLLPSGSHVVRERPSKAEWERLMGAHKGLSIWVTTVGSWNEKEAAETGGSESARLNMHRPHPDWGGTVSPWEQLRTRLERPLWVVYDESHNQTPAQLDQLAGLGPVGFLMASATPPASELFSRFDNTIRGDEVMAPIALKGRVIVRTKDVVEAQLLKRTLEVLDYESDPETMLDEVVARHRRLAKVADASGLSIKPKAIYVVEQSNPRRGSREMARPVSIWHYLRSKRIPTDEIALYTQTKEVPEGAEKIHSLSALEPRHRHIVFNQALQEGWDDPEAFLCYFDEPTNSYVRIQQIVGRVLRQPGAQHADDDALNTATLFVRVRSEKYDEVIDQIKRELSLYAIDDGDIFGSSAIRLKTRIERQAPLLPKVKHRRLKLPNYVLGEADLKSAAESIASQGRRRWADEDLEAPGVRRSLSISLVGQEDRKRYAQIAKSSTTPNGAFLRRRIQRLSRSCAHLLHPDLFNGAAYEQASCSGSQAQKDLAALALDVVHAYEQSVELQVNPIREERAWTVQPYQPGAGELLSFKNAAHPKYARSAFNKDELEFANALDAVRTGVWLRNGSRGVGYGLPLPVKVGDSSSFFPDFLWWVDGECFAIDPTGRYILEGKIRAKLLDLPTPRVVLVTRGKVSQDWTRREDADGWTMVRRRTGRLPAPEHFDKLTDLLNRLRGAASPGR